MNKSSKPLIAITGPDSGGTTAWLFTAANVYLSGGRPIRVQPKRFHQAFPVDGLIIGGGTDVHPDHYTEEKLSPVRRSFWTKFKEAVLYPQEFFSNLFSGGDKSYDKPRDLLEKNFLDYALKNDLPVLGICRGEQLINVHLGGTMVTSTLPLYKDSPRMRSVFPRKKVDITDSSSLLAKVIKKQSFFVNAIHSQCVGTPAASLKVVAREKNGIIQGVESDQYQRLLAVQWHPEYLIYKSDQRKLFNWIVNEAKAD